MFLNRVFLYFSLFQTFLGSFLKKWWRFYGICSFLLCFSNILYHIELENDISGNVMHEVGNAVPTILYINVIFCYIFYLIG